MAHYNAVLHAPRGRVLSSTATAAKLCHAGHAAPHDSLQLASGMACGSGGGGAAWRAGRGEAVGVHAQPGHGPALREASRRAEPLALTQSVRSEPVGRWWGSEPPRPVRATARPARSGAALDPRLVGATHHEDVDIDIVAVVPPVSPPARLQVSKHC